MQINASTPSVQPAAKPKAPERDRSQEYNAEQQRVQARRLEEQRNNERVQENRRQQAVINSQGQTTGRILNESA